MRDFSTIYREKSEGTFTEKKLKLRTAFSMFPLRLNAGKIRGCAAREINSTVQIKETVIAYFSSKRLLPFELEFVFNDENNHLTFTS